MAPPSDPQTAADWFNVGLAHKFERRWRDCAEANLRALTLASSAGDPAWWNLGIAATALHDWPLARKAWRGFGVTLEGDDNDPIAGNLGLAPMRLPNGETVWADRIDPARGIVRSIPFPESGFRWGDVVLNDGAPNGERVAHGVTYSVLDVIEKWSPSEIPTLAVEVNASSEDAQALVEMFEQSAFAAEDWSTVRILCKACSEGRPDSAEGGHIHEPPVGSGPRRIGIASPLGLARDVLARWVLEGDGGREFGDIEAVG